MTDQSAESRPHGWKYDLFLSVPNMDLEHHELIYLAGRLQSAFTAGAPRAECLHMLRQLIDLSGIHFASEEESMLASRYSGYATHKKQHEKLMQQLRLAEESLAAGEIRPCGALALFVDVWSEQHILGPDKAFAQFLLESARVA